MQSAQEEQLFWYFRRTSQGRGNRRRCEGKVFHALASLGEIPWHHWYFTDWQEQLSFNSHFNICFPDRGLEKKNVKERKIPKSLGK